MCLAATLAFFLMRLNLSFALVCMVREIRYSNDTNGSISFRHDISNSQLVSNGDDLLLAPEQKNIPDDVDDLYYQVRYAVNRNKQYRY